MNGKADGAAIKSLALVRLSSELSTKAHGTRRRFMRHLVSNLHDAFRQSGTPARIDARWNRIYVSVEGPPERLEVLSRVPGISSYSEVLGQTSGDLAEIVRLGTELFLDSVRGRKYAVRARRTGKHDYSSNDLMIQLGSALNEHATVDLDHPDVEVEVEVREQETFFFSGRVPGLGGLPLAVEGRAICLLSGGFDSAVAAWMMLKRGVQLDYLFCNLAGDAYERSVLRVAKVLADSWSYGHRPKLHVVDFSAVLDELRDRTEPKYWQLVLKRLMYRAADVFAQEADAQGIVTGEAIGQVSSQTLMNLAAIDHASEFPVFRPLIGFDKMDIIEVTRRIGTYQISSTVKEYCAIAPGNPATSARRKDTEAEEAKVDLSVLQKSIDDCRTIDLRSLSAAEIVVEYVYKDEVPEDAVVIDLRSEEEWEDWHYPDAENRAPWDLEADAATLSRDKVYLLYCTAGIQSAQIAESLQRSGVEAYAYRGGLKGLKRAAAAGVGR